MRVPLIAAVVAGLFALAVNVEAFAQGDEHWSRQFTKPRAPTAMGPGTGMSMGNGKPLILNAKWHDGKLWMAGAWLAGANPTKPTRRDPNTYWNLWTWSPEEGWHAFAHFGKKGGAGPDGRIYDMVWLPDGRMVVGGAFRRVDNLGGTMYHRVNGLAIYDPNEPTANKWRPLGSFQYNGTVYKGHIQALAYDPKSNDLFMGGNFGGVYGANSRHVHRYDFDTGTVEPMTPGVISPKTFVRKIRVDTSTTPSTVYVAGKFHYTGGEGLEPRVSKSKARYSTGFAAWREDVGWITFPKNGAEHKENILQRAADFKNFDSVNVLDFLLDGEDIWIVGAFSQGKGSGETLRGIAKWDAEAEKWIDPTGKGGIGREAFAIGKTEDGKIYIAGAFGGKGKSNGDFDGFKNGEAAAMVAVHDPATGNWNQVGSGLLSLPFPEARLATNGNDVYVVGDFHYIGKDNDKQKEFESFFIARWNEHIDFSKTPAKVAAKPAPPAAVPVPTKPIATGNAHWSRGFPKPPRRRRPDEPAHSGATGMDVGTGTPEIRGLAKLDDKLYFVGAWAAVPNSRWFVWSWHKDEGWEPLAWDERGKGQGPAAMPNGIVARDGKLWVHGGLPKYKGIAIWDPKAKSWSAFEGKRDGKTVKGHAMQQGGGTIYDLAWNDKTGDFYIVGASGLQNPDYQYPGDVAPIIRVDKAGAYHTMGHDIKPEDAKKPVKRFVTMHIDENQDPPAIYIGGTFNFNGPAPTKTKDQVYNVARWDDDKQDWGPIGKGVPPKWVERDRFPEGYPGLPARPTDYVGFLEPLFPRVHALITDKAGNLYAGGTIAVLDSKTLPVAKRVESFGIAKWDKGSDTWVGVAKTDGFSRDIIEMSWLDESESKLLVTGGFEYGNDWTPLNGVAIVEIATGEVEPLGGGLMLSTRDQTVAPMIRHVKDGDDIYFAGLFDHAGINANSLLATPVQSSFVALYNATKDFSKDVQKTGGRVTSRPKARSRPRAGGAAKPASTGTPTTGGATGSAASGGGGLSKSLAYKVRTAEEDLAKIEAALASGKTGAVKSKLRSVERVLKGLKRNKAASAHPRVLDVVKRYEAAKGKL